MRTVTTFHLKLPLNTNGLDICAMNKKMTAATATVEERNEDELVDSHARTKRLLIICCCFVAIIFLLMHSCFYIACL